MGQLIDKAILRKELRKLPSEMGFVRKSDVMQILSNQKCVYDVDKVIKQIEMIAIPVLDEDEHIVPESNIHETCEIEMVALSNTVEIVKAGGTCQ